jgi:hypothetical protein
MGVAWHDRILWRAREQAERHDELKRAGWWPCGECGQLNRPAHQECIVCKAERE